MGFMQRQVQHGEWLEIEADGTQVIPADLVNLPELALAIFRGDRDAAYGYVRDYLERSRVPNVEDYSIRTGYGARMSASGYLDCTEWSVFDTEEEANAHLEETYGDDDDDGE